MGAPYNLSNITDANNYADLITGAGLAFTDGWLPIVFLGAIFMVFIARFLSSTDPKSAFAGASFITGVCGLFFFWLGMVQGIVVVTLGAMVGLGVVFLVLEK